MEFDAELLLPIMLAVSAFLTFFSFWNGRKKKDRLKRDIDAIEGEDPFEARAKDIYDEQKRR